MRGVKKKYKLPEIGSIIKKVWKGKTYEMTIVNVNGTIHYKVYSNIFTSPTGAAKFITRQEINGWKFWKLDKLM